MRRTMLFSILLSLYLGFSFASEMLGLIGVIISQFFLFIVACFHHLLGWKYVVMILSAQVLTFTVQIFLMKDVVIGMVSNFAKNESISIAYVESLFYPLVFLLFPLIMFAEMIGVYAIELYVVKKRKIRERIGKIVG